STQAGPRYAADTTDTTTTSGPSNNESDRRRDSSHPTSPPSLGRTPETPPPPQQEQDRLGRPSQPRQTIQRGSSGQRLTPLQLLYQKVPGPALRILHQAQAAGGFFHRDNRSPRNWMN